MVPVKMLFAHAVREDLFEEGWLSSSGKPITRVVKCSLTNSALRPVSGCVRTIGCTTGFTCAICSADRFGRHGLRFCSSAISRDTCAPPSGLQPRCANAPATCPTPDACSRTAYRRLRGAIPARATVTQARLFLVRQIGMPEMTGIAETDRLAVFDDVRDDQHFRMARPAGTDGARESATDRNGG